MLSVVQCEDDQGVTLNARELASLQQEGWFTRDDFSATDDAVEAQRRVDADELHPAAISRGHVLDTSVRGDKTQWILADDRDFAALITRFEALRGELNREAWLGLTRFDVQLAHYPGHGEGYSRHRDTLRDADPASARRVTAIAYLNPRWIDSDGGALRIYATTPTDVAPRLGKLVVFLSAEVQHEVLPNFASRLAATAWYY